MKTIAIILAGGKGKRMGAPVSKQFIEIDDKPVIYYTIKKFEEVEEINEIILVLPKDEIDYFKTNIQNRFNFNISRIIEGGAERQDSVYNALRSVEDADIVLIHDGARAFVTNEIIKNGIRYAKEYGAAAPGVMPKDTIKVKDKDSFSKDTPIRERLVAVQTPQCFNYSLIKECHENVKREKKIVTDDTMVVEQYGHNVYLYEGEYKNIKITTKEDLILAKAFVKEQKLS